MAYSAGAYPGFHSMRRPGVLILPPPRRDGMPVYHPPASGFPYNSPVLIYTPGPGCLKVG